MPFSFPFLSSFSRRFRFNFVSIWPAGRAARRSIDSRERNVKFGSHSAIADDLGERLFFVIDDNSNKNARLQIKDVQDMDGGMYRCRVDFFNSATRNSRINLTLVGMCTRFISLFFSHSPASLCPFSFRLFIGELTIPGNRCYCESFRGKKRTFSMKHRTRSGRNRTKTVKRTCNRRALGALATASTRRST